MPAISVAQHRPQVIRVQVFVRTDCPISNRYAPEIQRLKAEFAARGVGFSLVYPDADETADQIQKNIRDYGYGGSAMPVQRDPEHTLAASAHATITPEAAVFDHDKLIYHGRIDDQVAAFGKVRAHATTHELEDAINAALAGRAPVVAYAPAVGCYLADVQR